MHDDDDRRRMQMVQQQRMGSSALQSQADPSMAMRYSGNNQRVSYRLNNTIYSRYRPQRPGNYRNKNLTQNDILRAVTSQYRPQESLMDLKGKLEKLSNKDNFAIRWYLEPYQKKHEEPDKVKTGQDFMLDEMEYMNIDFREERKLKKSLCTKFIHEISNVANNRKEK